MPPKVIIFLLDARVIEVNMIGPEKGPYNLQAANYN